MHPKSRTPAPGQGGRGSQKYSRRQRVEHTPPPPRVQRKATLMRVALKSALKHAELDHESDVAAWGLALIGGRR